MALSQACLGDSYSRHPCFQFDQSELELDLALFDAFVDSYALLCAFGPRLAPRQFASCKRLCTATLHGQFLALKGQTGDALEIAFFDELERECLRLLLEECSHFRGTGRGVAAAFASDQAGRDALRLRRDHFYFGILPATAVAEILAMGADDLARCRTNAAQGRLTREDLSTNSGPNIRGMLRLLNREFRALGVLDAVGAYAGSRMSATGLALELSVPQATWWANAFEGATRAPETLYAHLDESINFPKAIVYLTDVDQRSGPTSCYPHALEKLRLSPLQALVGRVIGNVGNGSASPLRGYYGKKYHQSMSSERFRRHFMRLPAAMRFNSHLGWDVCPGSALEQSLVAAEVPMLGPAGTFITFDGARLLHRGGMVQEGERVALQVVFSDATLVDRIASRVKRALP